MEKQRTLVKGNKELVRSFLRNNTIGAYVYILRRPNDLPFYVGKGGGGPSAKMRIFNHENEALQNHSVGESNPFKCNAIRKIRNSDNEIIYEIESAFGSDEQASYKREAELIAQFKPFHVGGCLTNLASATGNSFGQSEFSRKKHSATLSGRPTDNPERLLLNQYLAGIGPVESVPIKPLSQLKPIRHSTPHPQPRQLKHRLTYALIASAAAHGLNFSASTNIPRCFSYKGVVGIIENGVSRDILKAGLATLISAKDPRDEVYELNNFQCGLLVKKYGKDELLRRDLL